MTELYRKADTSLHDIGGHLCIQRGPRGIRTTVQSLSELLEIAAEEVPVSLTELDTLARDYFPAGAPLPPGARSGLPRMPADRLDPGYTQYLDARFEALGNDIGELKEILDPDYGKDPDPQERVQIAGQIERWVDATFWPNDRSAEAVRELAHAIRRNDLKTFVEGEGCARYDNDEGDRKVAAFKHVELLNRIDDHREKANGHPAAQAIREAFDRLKLDLEKAALA